jgi:hypothetical protein
MRVLDAIDENAAPRWPLAAEQESQKRGFSASSLAEQADEFSLSNNQVDLVQDGSKGRTIRHADVLDDDQRHGYVS